MWVEASAPSNIALIKYMGKIDPMLNKPCNTSLSYTLEHLRTFVRIKADTNLKSDQWQCLVRGDLRLLELSAKGREKFLKFFAQLKSEFKIQGYFQIESANNFPSDCGLASSASSFAALTLATQAWSQQHNSLASKDLLTLALLSKQGSGSSCRSFFGPWVSWSAETVQRVDLPFINLKHQVILCDESIKSISSSEAHKQVLTSDMFTGRPSRAEARFLNLNEAFNKNDWKSAFEICWSEFWDMHTLFHTAKPAFMYMNANSQLVLGKLLQQWQVENDGPLVTMDAGSNIHLLYRPDQTKQYNHLFEIFKADFSIWTDEGYRAKR